MSFYLGFLIYLEQLLNKPEILAHLIFYIINTATCEIHLMSYIEELYRIVV